MEAVLKIIFGHISAPKGGNRITSRHRSCDQNSKFPKFQADISFLGAMR